SNRSAVLFSASALLAERIEALRTQPFTCHSLGCAAGLARARPTVLFAADLVGRLPFDLALLSVDLDTHATVSVTTSSDLPPFDGYPHWLADDFVAYQSGIGLACVQVSSTATVSTASLDDPGEDVEVDIPIPDVISLDQSAALVACGFGEYYQYSIRVFRYR